MKTTLKDIRDAAPCRQGWSTLLRGLGLDSNCYDLPDMQVTIADVRRINNLSDASWAIRAVDGYDKGVWAYIQFAAKRAVKLDNEVTKEIFRRLDVLAAGGQQTWEKDGWNKVYQLNLPTREKALLFGIAGATDNPHYFKHAAFDITSSALWLYGYRDEDDCSEEGYKFNKDVSAFLRNLSEGCK